MTAIPDKDVDAMIERLNGLSRTLAPTPKTDRGQAIVHATLFQASTLLYELKTLQADAAKGGEQKPTGFYYHLMFDSKTHPAEHFDKWCELFKRIQLDALASQQRQQCPEGWVMVPKEPNEGMIEAARRRRTSDELPLCSSREVYGAMIAAAPEPPKA